MALPNAAGEPEMQNSTIMPVFKELAVRENWHVMGKCPRIARLAWRLLVPTGPSR